MVSSVRTGGFTALLIVLAVVLATAAVPMLSGHSPLEAVGPGSTPDIDGIGAEPGEPDSVDDPQGIDSSDDIEAGEGLIHGDFASLADDELVGGMAEIAGLIALLFGADELEGAVGEQPERQERDDSVDGETDDGDSDGTNDGTAGSETDAGGETETSFLDRLDPLTVGLFVGGLFMAAVGWIAYRTDRSLLGVVLSIPTLLFGAVTRFVFGITAVVERVTRAIHAASSVFALPGLFVAGVAQSSRDLAGSVRSLFDHGQPAADTGGVEQLPNEREQIRAAWRSVVEAVGDRRYRRRTPGEIERKAIDRGLPESPVSTLVGVFRDVEYGDKDPTDRAASAVSAAAELSEAAETADSTDEEPTTRTADESTDEEGTR